MKLKRTIHKTITNVIEHDVPKSAAALTYNLLFALFALLIFVSNLLGLLDLNVVSITAACCRLCRTMWFPFRNLI
ncbi:MAG: hypothetical protein E7464_03680 [Ruminococcaceae bacterium]|nr:hypothetical protein [Oscillospiraceae bacterium]